MSLRDPLRKMSKSDQSPNSRIELTDADDVISKKIQRAVTDTTSAVSFNPEGRPGVSNLVSMYAALTSQTPDEVCQLMQGKDTSQLKSELIDCITATIGPIRLKITELQANEVFVIQKLNEGCCEAAELAYRNFSDIKSLIGI